MKKDKLQIVFVAIAIGALIGAFAVNFYMTHKTIDTDTLRDNYIALREQAIQQAIVNGEYSCCIGPACTMCMDRGKNHTWSGDGKYCNCLQIIFEGGEPCPQCKAGLARGEELAQENT